MEEKFIHCIQHVLDSADLYSKEQEEQRVVLRVHRVELIPHPVVDSVVDR